MSKDFVEIELPQQKFCDGVLFPGVVSPNPSLHLSEFVESVKEDKAWLESLLLSRGAILFRDFPVKTAEDFNQVVEGFGYEEYPYVGGVAPRTHVVGRVLTANESEQDIPFHHEMAHAPECPTKIFFFCDEEPRNGGETPIVLSHLICERMIQKYPEFVEKLEQGVIYRRIIGQGDDPASAFGRGWQSTFSTTDKSIAEESSKTRNLKKKKGSSRTGNLKKKKGNNRTGNLKKKKGSSRTENPPKNRTGNPSKNRAAEKKIFFFFSSLLLELKISSKTENLKKKKGGSPPVALIPFDG